MANILLLDQFGGGQPEVGLFPKEVGHLWIGPGPNYPRFYTSAGAWVHRGYSWFLGFLRYSRGEDILPDLRYFRANGINTVRLFGPLPWEELHGSYTYQNFNFQKMDSFLTLLEQWGIRVNWSVAPGLPDPGLRPYASQFYEVASGHWNIFTELVNEPDNGIKPDPIRDFQGINRHGILTAYGYYPIERKRTVAQTPILDFGTVHLPRDSQWHRKARDAQWLSNETDELWLDDEPAKIAEPWFSGAGVKNDWASTPQEAAWHFGVAALWTPGGTVHTQHGRNGTVPEPGTLTHAAIESVRDNVWKVFPNGVQFGGYMGSHFSTSPVDGTETASGGPVWTYSSVHQHVAWSVRCYESSPNARNGWTIVERWGPSGSFVRLER